MIARAAKLGGHEEWRCWPTGPQGLLSAARPVETQQAQAPALSRRLGACVLPAAGIEMARAGHSSGQEISPRRGAHRCSGAPLCAIMACARHMSAPFASPSVSVLAAPVLLAMARFPAPGQARTATDASGQIGETIQVSSSSAVILVATRALPTSRARHAERGPSATAGLA